MRGDAREADVREAVESAVRGGASRRSKRETVVLALDVEPEVRESLRNRARSLGVSLTEYMRALAAGNAAPHHVSLARIAQPLAAVAYRLSLIAEARAHGDHDALDKEIMAARTIVVDSLAVLAKEHASEGRRVERNRPNPWEGM